MHFYNFKIKIKYYKYILRMIDVIGLEIKLKSRRKNLQNMNWRIIYLGLLSVAFLSLILDLLYRRKPIIVYNKDINLILHSPLIQVLLPFQLESNIIFEQLISLKICTPFLYMK